MRRFQKLVSLATLALFISACAAPKKTIDPQAPMPAPAPAPSSSTETDVKQVCNPIIIGLGAAAVCAALGRGTNRVRTGAACGALATLACYLLNGYKARETKTAAQVQQDYLRNNPQLPEKAIITAYRSEVEPRGAVSRGQDVTLTSTIVVVPGRNDPNVAVEEELTIVDARNETWGRPARKVANPTGQAGEFQTSYTIAVRDGMSQGIYQLRRTIYLNGVAVHRDDTSTRFQVVGSPFSEGLALTGSAVK